MNQPLITLLLHALQQTSHLSCRQAQQPSRLLLKPLSLDHTMQHFQSVSFSTIHLDPLAFLEEHEHRTSLPEG
jgi:hypothetical protein